MKANHAAEVKHDHLNEIADMLAIGLMRLRTRQSSELSPHARESSLDCAARQSGPADVLTSEGGLN